MGQLIAFANRIGGTPGIEVGKDAFASPFRRSNDQNKHTGNQEGHHQEHPSIHATQKQDTHRNDGDHHECAHIWLYQQQAPHNGHCSGHRQHRCKELLFDFHFAHHVIGGIQQHAPLR